MAWTGALAPAIAPGLGRRGLLGLSVSLQALTLGLPARGPRVDSYRLEGV